MNYKDLQVWQKSRKQNLSIYQLTQKFPKEEMWGLTSQMRRCSVSVASNIAEGSSRATTKDCINFLYITKASCSELECQLLLSEDIKYIEPTAAKAATEKCEEITKMLNSLIKKLKEKIE